VFCSFLAVVLRKELDERLAAARLKPEWRELLADLDRLQEIEVEQDGKRFILRTPVTGVAGKGQGRRREPGAGRQCLPLPSAAALAAPEAAPPLPGHSSSGGRK
jgi:hypothetical protein